VGTANIVATFTMMVCPSGGAFATIAADRPGPGPVLTTNG
jgi:hypothetical protein